MLGLIDWIVFYAVSAIFQPYNGGAVLGIWTEALWRNGTPPLFDVLPFEINNENYFLLIGFICTNFDNFPRSSVG